MTETEAIVIGCLVVGILAGLMAASRATGGRILGAFFLVTGIVSVSLMIVFLGVR